MENKLLISALFLTLAGSAVPLAAPASAGCQSAFVSIFGGGQRCDGPVDGMGNFTRCDSGHGMGIGGSNCYLVRMGDPAQPPRIP